MRPITFKIEEDLLEKLDELAENMGKTRSELVREAIIYLLSTSDYNPNKHYKHIKIES